MLKGDSLATYKQLWSTSVLSQVAQGRAVIIGDRTSLQYHAALHCWDYPDSELYFMKERLLTHPMVVYYNRRTARRVMQPWGRK